MAFEAFGQICLMGGVADTCGVCGVSECPPGSFLEAVRVGVVQSLIEMREVPGTNFGALESELSSPK